MLGNQNLLFGSQDYFDVYKRKRPRCEISDYFVSKAG